jgi:hypothetical protein
LLDWWWRKNLQARIGVGGFRSGFGLELGVHRGNGVMEYWNFGVLGGNYFWLPGVTGSYRDLLKGGAGLPGRRRKWWNWELRVDPGCMTGRVPAAGRGFQWIFGAAAEKSARAAWRPHDLASRTWSSSFVREYARWR